MPLKYSIMVRYYAKKFAKNNNIRVRDSLKSAIPYISKIGIDKINDNVKFDLTDEDIAKFYNLIKETYPEEFQVDSSIFVDLVRQQANRYINKQPDETADQKVEEKEEEKKEELKIEEKKEETKEVEENVKEELKKPSADLSAEFLDEMKSQLRNERALFKRMRDKKAEVVQTQKQSTQESEAIPDKPKINWSFILMIGGVIAGIAVVMFFMNRKKTVVQPNNTVQSNPVQETKVNSDVINAVDLFSRLGV